MWPTDAALLLNNLLKVVEGLLGKDSQSYHGIRPCTCWVCGFGLNVGV